MLKSISMAGVIALALAAATAPAAQEKGHGNGRAGQDHAGEHGGQGRGARGGPGQGEGQGQDRGRESGPSQARPAAARAERTADAHPGDEARDRAQRAVRAVREARAPDRDDGREAVLFRRPPDRGLIAGCPPGLARKNNGCLPPGQARQMARDQARYDYLWNRPTDAYRYRYDNGYLYRLNPDGGLLGYLPALGGALAPGAVWPAQYGYQPVPPYYGDYYRLGDRYSYRYADGVLYGVDPQTQAIGQVAALLTGQQWTVGQAMPAGYDVYNLPYAYRDRYPDTPQSLYRYNDGYVYQVDPTTRLVQAVIQLVT